MRIVWCLLVAVVLGALATAGVVAAPVVARDMAMGFTHVGLADGPNAFQANPAGLPSLAEYNAGMKSAAAISARIDGDEGEAWSALYSAASGSKPIGWGAGFWQMDAGASETDFFGLGIGGRLLRTGELAGGLSLVNVSQSGGQTGDDDATSLNVGLMYHLMPAAASVRIGARVNDVADDLPGDVTIDLGASARFPQGLIVALDVLDVADEVETTVNLGAEYPVPQTALLVRAGATDGDLTLGAGYRWPRWEVGAAWADLDGGDQAVLSVTGWW